MTTLQTLSPWFLPLLLLAPLAAWRFVSSQRRLRIGYSSRQLLHAGGSTIALKIRWVIPALRAGAIALLALCLARPVIANQQTKMFVEGSALQFVVDRSGSMRALDFELNGKTSDRLEAVKQVGSAFIQGGEGLAGRPDDLVGLITFARYADSLSPLTLDHAYVVDALRKLKSASVQTEDGTAIGDAVALAVDRLRDAMKNAPVKQGDDPTRDSGRQPIQSAAIILLTDGENNAGDVDPKVAADLAATYGIKIYTIGVGTKGTAPFPVGTDQFGRQIIRQVPVTIDEALLKEMAARTGGEYFRATDTESLRAIYDQIDSLEKTKTEQRHSMHYTDLAVQAARFRGFSIPALLLGVLILLAAEMLLSTTRFRTLN